MREGRSSSRGSCRNLRRDRTGISRGYGRFLLRVCLFVSGYSHTFRCVTRHLLTTARHHIISRTNSVALVTRGVFEPTLDIAKTRVTAGQTRIRKAESRAVREAFLERHGARNGLCAEDTVVRIIEKAALVFGTGRDEQRGVLVIRTQSLRTGTFRNEERQGVGTTADAVTAGVAGAGHDTAVDGIEGGIGRQEWTAETFASVLSNVSGFGSGCFSFSFCGPVEEGGRGVVCMMWLDVPADQPEQSPLHRRRQCTWR